MADKSKKIKKATQIIFKERYMVFVVKDHKILTKDVFNDFINFLSDEIKGKQRPVIFVSNLDLFEQGEEAQVDPRVKFLDSSIWFYFYHNKDLDLSKDIENQVSDDEHWRWVTNQIKKFFEYEVYDSAIANEYLDYILQIAKVKLQEGGAHAGSVMPLVFHSEWEMKQKADELFEKIKNYKWSFLLIDDFAKKGLRKYGNKGFGNITKQEILKIIINEEIIGELDTALAIDETNLLINKYKIVQDALKKIIKQYKAGEFDSEPIKDNKVETAKQKIKEKTYDVLLLDYLFSNEKIIEKGKPQYGTKLFGLIQEGKIKQNKGIKNKYWIFPVSVFNSALLSDLKEKGFSYYTMDWYFTPGADPINTPQLFKYQLYKFLELQISYFPLELKDLFNILLENSDILDVQKKEESLRDYAYRTLPYFLEKYGFVFQLDFVKNKSKFYESLSTIINSKKCNGENEKEGKENNKLIFTPKELAKEIRDFLNYAYNPLFQRNKLLASFTKLLKYKDNFYKYCSPDKKLKDNLNDLFELLPQSVIKL